MKETGLMFKAPLVRSILDGTKTQTRRIAKEFAGRDDLDAILRRFPNQNGCPYGGPGDRIYVRETFAHFERNENFKPGCTAYFRADGECVDLRPWRPAIHMPKHAARIWLDITGVRLERLQDISEADAKAEGVDAEKYQGLDRAYARAFSELWESTGGDWAANPWVWVIDFKRDLAQKGQP